MCASSRRGGKLKAKIRAVFSKKKKNQEDMLRAASLPASGTGRQGLASASCKLVLPSALSRAAVCCQRVQQAADLQR